MMATAEKEYWEPQRCPKCNRLTMKEIPGQYQYAWKCKRCGTEIWTGPMPTFQELHDLLHSSPKEVLYSGYIKDNGRKKGGSKSGRRRKKKKTYYVRKPLDS